MVRTRRQSALAPDYQHEVLETPKRRRRQTAIAEASQHSEVAGSSKRRRCAGLNRERPGSHGDQENGEWLAVRQGGNSSSSSSSSSSCSSSSGTKFIPQGGNSSSSSSSSSCSSSSGTKFIPQAAPHLLPATSPVPYKLVIPTYMRWQPVNTLSGKKKFNDSTTPFILAHTLAFLSSQLISPERVTLFVADRLELEKYRMALQGSLWADVDIQVAFKGNMNVRNYIMKFVPSGTYVVNLDDDVENVMWKAEEGNTPDACRVLPPGKLETLIFHAYRTMRERGAFLWGLNTSKSVRHMLVNGISMRLGLVNGSFNGYITRPECEDLLRSVSDTTEDSEFSVRHYVKDGVILRYRMYAAITSPFVNGGGVQARFPSTGGTAHRSQTRKKEEQCAALQLHNLFPHVMGMPETKRMITTMTTCFTKSSCLRANSSLQVVKPVMNMKLVVKRKAMKAMKAAKPMKAMKAVKAMKTMKETQVAIEQRNPTMKRRHDDDRLRWKAGNPKLAGSEAFKRYAKYRGSATVGECRRRGATRMDLHHDIAHGFAQVIPKPIAVACLGDSNTVGYGGCNGGYPKKLQAYLDDHASAGTYRVSNFGRNSARAVANPGRIHYASTDDCAHALALNADVYVIMLGTNDASHKDGEPDKVADGVSSLIEQIHSSVRGANPRIMLVLPPGALPGQLADNMPHIIHPALRKLASRLQVALVNPKLSPGEDYQQDKVHLNASGVLKLAGFVGASILKKA